MKLGRLLACALAAAAWAGDTAWAQGEPVANYPSRPVRIVVPFPPGGGVDVLARLLTPGLGERLGRTVLVENKPGANARVGADTVAKADPDGYTLFFSTYGALVLAPHMGGKPPYDPLTDFQPITVVARSANVIAATPGSPISTIADLIAAAKKAPGKLNYGSSGVGGPPHLAFEMLKNAAGIDIVHVPFKGTADANTAIASGTVELAISVLPAVSPLVKAGRVKALAVTSAKRSPALPDVPTVGETVPGYETSTWFAFLAPAKTPRPIVDKIRDTVLATLKDPAVVQAFERDGSEIATTTPEELGALIRADYERYGKLIRTLDIKD